MCEKQNESSWGTFSGCPVACTAASPSSLCGGEGLNEKGGGARCWSFRLGGRDEFFVKREMFFAWWRDGVFVRVRRRGE